MGYSPRGRKESDTTERLHFHFLPRENRILKHYYLPKPQRTKSTTLDFFFFLAAHMGEDNGTPIRYSCLENPMDGGAW